MSLLCPSLVWTGVHVLSVSLAGACCSLTVPGTKHQTVMSNVLCSQIPVWQCRTVYSACVTHRYPGRRSTSFRVLSATDPLPDCLPNTEPRFSVSDLPPSWSLSPQSSHSELENSCLFSQLLPPCDHPSLCSAKIELSNHQSPLPGLLPFFF